MKYIDGYRNGDAAAYMGRKIASLGKKLADAGREIRMMEVCGTHTMSIARHGIRDLLPSNVKLISGPGCPVCVTDAGYVDAAINLAKKGVIITTFGDMVRVPGSKDTLADARSEGATVKICYSPLEAVEIASLNPDKEVVFLGIGFETTVPPVLSLVKKCAESSIPNLSVLTAFKLVPPALTALLVDPEVKVDAFICPAHVSAIIGSDAYAPFVDNYRVPCVVAGFEPLDILFGICEIVEQAVAGEAKLINQYSRVVKPEGNLAAQRMIDRFLTVADASWRGIGTIPLSGLCLKDEYSKYNAATRFNVSTDGGDPDSRCRCGDVLKGKISPSECPLFDRACNPTRPIGPCMVSSEGSCAAHYKYAR